VGRQELEQVLALLSEREREILSLRFGLMGEEPLTLEDVGRRFGLTRERIRQLEAKALAKVRQSRVGPRCSSCSAPLSGARYRLVEVPGDDGGSAQVLFLYCGACGSTIDQVILPGE
jgi:hypothetical protein